MQKIVNKIANFLLTERDTAKNRQSHSEKLFVWHWWFDKLGRHQFNFVFFIILVVVTFVNKAGCNGFMRPFVVTFVLALLVLEHFEVDADAFTFLNF